MGHTTRRISSSKKGRNIVEGKYRDHNCGKGRCSEGGGPNNVVVHGSVLVLEKLQKALSVYVCVVVIEKWGNSVGAP